MPLSPGPRRASGLALAACLLAGCQAADEPAAGPADDPANSGLRFQERAETLGLGRTGQTYAAASADFDRDGWPDLAVSRHGSIALYRNLAGQGFEEVTGIGRFDRGDTHGVSWLDWNADGWPDLYVSRGAGRGKIRRGGRLHLNRGGEAFEVADLDGAAENARGRGRSATPWDLNGDGRLDLMILNHYQPDRPQRLALSAGDGHIDAARDMNWHERKARTATAFRLGGETAWVLTGYGRDAGRIYRRDEAGRFVDITDRTGVMLGHGFTVTAVAVGDVNNDGQDDLYYVNAPRQGQGAAMTGQGLEFRYTRNWTPERAGLRVEADGAFTLRTWAAGHQRHTDLYLGPDARTAGAEVHVASDDETLDGAPSFRDAKGGLYAWRTGPGEYELRFHPGPDGPHEMTGRLVAGDGELRLAGQYGDHRLGGEAANELYVQEDGRLRATGAAADPGPGSDALFADFDNDGDLDLYVLNGSAPFDNPPNRLFENRGGLEFVDVTGEAGAAGTTWGRGTTVLSLDHDRDGRMDLFMTNGEGAPPRRHEGPYELFHNVSEAGNWLRVQLDATTSNSMALGTRVIVETPEGRQQRFMGAATGALVTSWLPLHFGLGEAGAADVTVRWPSGRVQRRRVEANALVTFEEPAAGQDAAGQVRAEPAGQDR